MSNGDPAHNAGESDESRGSPGRPDVPEPEVPASDVSEFALLDTHPNAPRRGPVYLAFALVVLAGVLGGLIGWSLADATCTEQAPLLRRLLAGAIGRIDAPRRSCVAQETGGALGGALIAASGCAVVAVLALRAMAEWRRSPPPPQWPART
jgi:hypothetical protein